MDQLTKLSTAEKEKEEEKLFHLDFDVKHFLLQKFISQVGVATKNGCLVSSLKKLNRNTGERESESERERERETERDKV